MDSLLALEEMAEAAMTDKKKLAEMPPEDRWTWMHSDANAKKSVMPSLAALRDADRLASRIKTLEEVLEITWARGYPHEWAKNELAAARAEQGKEDTDVD